MKLLLLLLFMLGGAHARISHTDLFDYISSANKGLPEDCKIAVLSLDSSTDLLVSPVGACGELKTGRYHAVSSTQYAMQDFILQHEGAAYSISSGGEVKARLEPVLPPTISCLMPTEAQQLQQLQAQRDAALTARPECTHAYGASACLRPFDQVLLNFLQAKQNGKNCPATGAAPEPQSLGPAPAPAR